MDDDEIMPVKKVEIGSDIKICLACSAGGHLTEMLHLKGCYRRHNRFFLTFERGDTKELAKDEKVYFVEDPGRNPIKLALSVFHSMSLIMKEKPDVVISTGAGVGVVACYVAKIVAGSKVVFVESFARVKEPSFSGKLAYLIADRFFVQWPELQKAYGERAQYAGGVV
jgi:beta-1,4-N-acetylglucosaminyltransferase